VGIKVIVIDQDRVSAKLGNRAARMRILATGVTAQLAVVQGAVVPLTPVGVTSNLRGSWHSDPVSVIGSKLIGVMGSPLIYSEVIERGRRAGAKMPPPAALQTWVERKLGSGASAFVVARSIGRKGIKGRFMLSKAVALTAGLRAAIRARTAAKLLDES
jgi:hypothetical protein